MMRSLAAVALAASWQLHLPAASAQTQQPSQAPSPSTSVQKIPDQKLDATAAALQRVASLQQDYQSQIASAAPSDKQRVSDEAHKALVKAVTDQGLSVDEYTSILQAAKTDPEVRDKILKRLPPSDK
jgi:hypothetical protein